MELILKVLTNPQVQAAIIAAIVSLIVALLITHRSKRAGQAIRAEKLLEVYNPIETFLQEKKSLYDYVSRNKAMLKKSRPNFSKGILALIDEAIREHYQEPGRGLMSLGGPDAFTPKENESMEKLQNIQNRLVPILTREINRLRKIVDKG